MTARLVCCAAVASILMTTSACGASDHNAPDGDAISVVTALYPIAFVADRVGGDDIALTNLATPGVEPHDLELAPQQVATIAEADVVVYLAGLSPAVDEAVEQNAPDRALEVSAVVHLVEASDDDGHDPHFWLDPTRVGQLATHLADYLIGLDPDHAEGYTQRAAALGGELDRLDQDFDAGLASCANRTIVTAHAAFGYLAARYGLEQLSVTGLEPAAEPSAARIADVLATIEAGGGTTVYFEPLTGADVVASIADDLGLATAVLDPVESADPDSEDDYLSIMRANLATLEQGQSC